ncbi:Tat pathway signal sequence domain protein [Streptomyces sp. NBC_01304]|uniref:Tat pathway signal sequence domain protein n=1 Tax=Streptomyces sp. NBC_01304 TaxID=2903818 RepID=UPI002E0F26E1|nr:Tat pathway signal sequence domain protein [Streptomyces sp. NBC_01304]
MRNLVRQNLGKVVAGAAVALTGTAIAVAVALPGAAGAGERDAKAEANAAAQQAVRPGVVEKAPAEGDKGVGSDPLTDDEIKKAEQLAMGGGLQRSARDVEGDRGPQHLSTNLTEVDPSEVGDATPARRAEIVYYDYKADALVTKTVNLDTGKVEDTQTAKGAQPPPAKDEMREAAELLIADPLGADLKKDYKDATGKALTSADQLELSGFIFRKATAPRAPGALAKCGEHRCLSVVSKVANGPWIDTRNLVVDLSDRKVTKLG